MGEVVINNCYGGFNLSNAAIKRYAELVGLELTEEKNYPGSSYSSWRDTAGNYFSDGDLRRDDPVLVQVVKELGKKTNGMCANLVIEEIPTGTLYRITKYDGYENIETRGETDWHVAA